MALSSHIFMHQPLTTMAFSSQLGNHRSALTTLVHDLHDAPSAEAYCTLGGDLVPVKTAQSLAENDAELELWAAALFGIMLARSSAKVEARAAQISRQKSVVDEGLKKELLKVLLEVYMSDGWVLGFGPSWLVADNFDVGRQVPAALHI